MASVTGIGSEICGNCVEEIDVYVELEYEGGWLCCGRLQKPWLVSFRDTYLSN